jgi:alpha-beta hydrolase superfamily lysophospholipase
MSAAQPSAQPGPPPTVVPVHGAFADASSWNGVIERLQQQGCTVVAPANPLRGLTCNFPHRRRPEPPDRRRPELWRASLPVGHAGSRERGKGRLPHR